MFWFSQILIDNFCPEHQPLTKQIRENSHYAAVCREADFHCPGLHDIEFIIHPNGLPEQIEKNYLSTFPAHIELHSSRAFNEKYDRNSNKYWFDINCYDEDVRNKFIQMLIEGGNRDATCMRSLHHKDYYPDIIDVLKAGIPVGVTRTIGGDCVENGRWSVHWGFSTGYGYDLAASITFDNYQCKETLDQIIMEYEMAQKILNLYEEDEDFKKNKKIANFKNIDDDDIKHCNKCDIQMASGALAVFVMVKHDQQNQQVMLHQFRAHRNHCSFQTESDIINHHELKRTTFRKMFQNIEQQSNETMRIMQEKVRKLDNRLLTIEEKVEKWESDKQQSLSTAICSNLPQCEPTDSSLHNATDPSLPTLPSDPSLSTPPIDPSLSTPPIDPSLSTAQIDSSLSTPLIDPSLSTAQIDSSLSTAPIDSSLSTPQIDSSLSTAPIDLSLSPSSKRKRRGSWGKIHRKRKKQKITPASNANIHEISLQDAIKWCIIYGGKSKLNISTIGSACSSMKYGERKKLLLSFGYLSKTLSPTQISMCDWQQNNNWYEWIMKKMQQNGIEIPESREGLTIKFDTKSVAMDYKTFNINLLTSDLWQMLNSIYILK